MAIDKRNLDTEFLTELYKTIRAAEQKNVRTGQYDDKAMAAQIEKFVHGKVKQKMEKESNNS